MKGRERGREGEETYLTEGEVVDMVSTACGIHAKCSMAAGSPLSLFPSQRHPFLVKSKTTYISG